MDDLSAKNIIVKIIKNNKDINVNININNNNNNNNNNDIDQDGDIIMKSNNNDLDIIFHIVNNIINN